MYKTLSGIVPRNGRLAGVFLLLGFLWQLLPSAGSGTVAAQTALIVSLSNLTPEIRCYHQDATCNLVAV